MSLSQRATPESPSLSIPVIFISSACKIFLRLPALNFLTYILSHSLSSRLEYNIMKIEILSSWLTPWTLASKNMWKNLKYKEVLGMEQVYLVHSQDHAKARWLLDGNDVQGFHFILQLIFIDHLLYMSHYERHMAVQRGEYQWLPVPALQVFTLQRGGRYRMETLWVQSSIVLEWYTGGHANYNWAERERVEGNSRKRKSHFPSILGVKKVF